MRKIIRMSLLVMMMALMLVACEEKKPKTLPMATAPAPELKDSTIYGRCGDGCSMNMVELINSRGDTLYFMKDQEAIEDPVKGGLSVGDNMAVMPGKREDGETIAQVAVNLTTLLGKWTSLDKNFEIKDDGVVATTASAESNPWHSWRIYNGKLILGKDTFSVCELGADSLYLENKEGIFAYKRQY